MRYRQRLSYNYILDKYGNPVKEKDLQFWWNWFRNTNRTLKKTIVKGGQVITTFIGIDFNMGVGEPLIYETLVDAKGRLNGETRRYSTKDEAEKGHEKMVKLAREGQDDKRQRHNEA